MTDKSTPHLARCGCGALTAETHGAPAAVYLCSCKVCQITSGSAFTYAAVFSGDDVVVRGEHKAWRHIGESGRWVETHFCPTCGATVFFYAEGMPGEIGVSVGGFADDDRAAVDAALAPQRMYWASRRRAWVEPPEGAEIVEMQ